MGKDANFTYMIALMKPIIRKASFVRKRIDTDELGRFCMEEEDFTRWQRDLAVLQNSEDMRFFLKDRVDYQELDNYIYEETRYITSAAAAIKEENISLKRLERALCEKDAAWLKDNGFIKTEI